MTLLVKPILNGNDVVALGELTPSDTANIVGPLVVESDSQFTSTGALKLPVGTNAQRPMAPVRGMTRVNSDTSKAEFFDGASWVELIGAGKSITGSTITASNLTAGRVTYAGTGGLLTDSADLTFDGNTLSVGGSVFRKQSASSGYLIYGSNGLTNNGLYYDQAASELSLWTVSTKRFGIDLNGTVTSYNKLFISGGDGNARRLGFDAPGHYYNWIESDGSANNGFMRFATNDTERMRLDSSGNLGLGVTPSAWYTGQNTKSLQIGNTGAYVGISNESFLSNNHYVNISGVDTYAVSGVGANQFRLSNGGGFVWYTAPVGTAGQPINFNQAMTLNENGNLWINKANGLNSTAGLRFSTDATNGGQVLISRAAGAGSQASVVFFNDTGGQSGNITTTLSTTSYNTTSDYRLKENVTPMSGALERVGKLKPVDYTWKIDGTPCQGFIAHELQEIVPECVTGEKDATRIEEYEIEPAVPATYDEDGNELTPYVAAVIGEREVPDYQSIDTSFLVATLTAAIQELNAKVDAQAALIAKLSK